MRIIAGEYRGRLLKSVKDRSVRPATDRVRESLFNILTNQFTFEGLSVLDLFAGSGSVGLEALSRGASRVVFVEYSYPVVKILSENISSLGSGAESRCEVIRLNAYRFLKENLQQFNVIFVDPPYAQDEVEKLPDLIFERNLIQQDGILVMEHTKKICFPPSSLYIMTDQRAFGMTMVSFFQSTGRKGLS